MNTAKYILPVAAVLAGMASAAPAAANPHLDARAYITVQEPLSQKSIYGGATLHVKEGALLRIYCQDTISLDRPWDKDNPGWIAGTWGSPGGFQSLLRINGGLMEIFFTEFPPNTKLGKAHGLNTPNFIRFEQPVVYWVAKGVGNHEVNCLTDTTHALPDKNRGNNVAHVLIKVSPAKPVAKGAAQPPAQVPPADQGLLPLATEVRDARQAPPARDAAPEVRPARSEPEPTTSRRPPPAAATRGTVAPVTPSPQDAAARAMKAADCVLAQARVPGHYACPTPAGLARCERLRAAKQVLGCTISE